MTPKELAEKWCNRSLTFEDLPHILYYYAQEVRGILPTSELINTTMQFISMGNGLDVDLAMHDICIKCNINVIEVQSKPDEFGRRQVLYRKLY